MDCDFSHDPADVPRLIAACADGADLALGSRYVAGGGTENWGRIRRLISRGALASTRALCSAAGARSRPAASSASAGRCSERIDLDSIARDGLRLPDRDDVPRAARQGFRVVEVPILFADRTAGDSKMSRAIVLEAVARVPALRLAAVTGTAVTELDEATFDAAVARRAGARRLLGAVVPAVQGVEPILAELPVEVARVNIDEEPGIASRFDVLSIPTVILFAGGEARRIGRRGAPPRVLRAVASGSAPSRRVSTAPRRA